MHTYLLCLTDNMKYCLMKQNKSDYDCENYRNCVNKLEVSEQMMTNAYLLMQCFPMCAPVHSSVCRNDFTVNRDFDKY